jgi:hypothetical protein
MFLIHESIFLQILNGGESIPTWIILKKGQTTDGLTTEGYRCRRGFSFQQCEEGNWSKRNNEEFDLRKESKKTNDATLGRKLKE